MDNADKLPNGKVIVPWPGTILHYYAATEIVRWEDYDLRFDEDAQKFASFGNGVTVEGFNPTGLPWLHLTGSIKATSVTKGTGP